MKSMELVFTVLDKILKEKYEEDKKLNICHNICYGKNKNYLLRVKSINGYNKQNEKIVFLFEIKKFNSLPIELISESIEDGLGRVKELVNNDDFEEILVESINTNNLKINIVLNYIVGFIGILFIVFSLVYFVFGIYYSPIDNLIKISLLILGIIFFSAGGFVFGISSHLKKK